MMYIVRIEYIPKGGLRESHAWHRAVARIRWDKIKIRSQAVLGDRCQTIMDISIEAKTDIDGDDYLIVAGPSPFDD